MNIKVTMIINIEGSSEKGALNITKSLIETLDDIIADDWSVTIDTTTFERVKV